MATTGGGPGSNQYGPKGTSHRSDHTRDGGVSHQPEVELRFDELPRDEVVHAGVLSWSLSTHDLTAFRPTSVPRAIQRFQKRRTNLIYNDVRLEGSPFTLPEVFSLIDGVTVDGKTEHDINQVIALSEAVELLLRRVMDGEFRLGKALSDELHGVIAQHEAIESGAFRGEGSVGGGGAVSTRESSFQAHAPGPLGADLLDVYATGLDSIQEIAHPVLRGATYAAFAAYHQFYFDGNKRTSRYVMNGELLSHGYDAIVTPVSRKGDYERSLTEMFMTGNADPYIAFTLSCYDDRES